MSYPINYPTPQGANVQIFSQGGSTSDWVKPQGASFVWFTLIGAGGSGGVGGLSGNSNGGASGAVTNFMGPAFLIPDVLRVTVGLGGARVFGVGSAAAAGNAGTESSVGYQQKDTTQYTLLTANGGAGGPANASVAVGGSASTSNFFSCMGFFQSVAGQDGSTGGNSVSASATTFLSGGAGGGADPTAAGGSVTPNYGYTVASGSAAGSSPFGISAAGGSGYFNTQPILVGCGGAGSGGVTNDPANSAAGRGGAGGVGCGGGGVGYSPVSDSASGKGGDGFVVIITW
jgi:hypothetical protein